jgi:glycosyltransferase involved in cell wall biosynthesis
MINPKPVKVLHINGGSMDHGGISKILMTYFEHVDSTKINFDFLVHYKAKDNNFEKIILDKRSNLYILPKKAYFIRFLISALKIIKNYDIIHCHADTMNWLFLLLGKLSGVKIRISHSHNTNYLTTNYLKIVVLKILKPLNHYFATHIAACSFAAATWLFGKKHAQKAKIIYNAIDISKFSFNSDKRSELRKKLNIEKQIVLGHVGKFDFQKNHIFIIKMFKSLVELNPNLRLVLIGDGPLRDYVNYLIHFYKINDFTINLGLINNVNDYYNIFDLFVFPSLFEGLPITLIEAQINNLPCFVSPSVPDEAKLIQKYYKTSIDNVNEWIIRVDNFINDNISLNLRSDYSKNVKNQYSKYDIFAQSTILETYYTLLYNEI